MAFTCHICHGYHDLAKLADMPCNCLVCTVCIQKDIETQLGRVEVSIAPVPKPQVINPGDVVMYLTGDGNFVQATVEIVDITVQPPQYGIHLPGRDAVRFTEGNRLFGLDNGSAGPQPSPPPRKQQRLQTSASGHLTASCACCSKPLGLPLLRALAPQVVASWEADRTAAWLRVHDILACPHAGCGALIQRVPGSSAGAQPAAAVGAGPAAAAAAHREQHRYRCSACGRDFCDACLAAPYHTGLTCRQARAPDCLLCGGKVDEDRLQKLLPQAAARAAVAGCDSQTRRSGRHHPCEAAASPACSADSLRCAGRSRARADEEEDEAVALVRGAKVSELRAALERKLHVDTKWCLERRDLERALLRWGHRTCSGPECAAKLRDMCTRPLACGHWCCGLRGEGAIAEADEQPGASHGQGPRYAHPHPRCVECGDASGPAASGAVSPAPGTASVGGPSVVNDCCFCWEPLSSGPCVEMACGPRHMCHLECALARLAAGYPGPHISFTHLYCPLCRTATGANGGSGGYQSALGPVHLEHPALAAALEPHLALRAEVVAAVRTRLKMDPALKSDPELRPGGQYDGRPADYGLDKLLFYKCSKCSKPYYGGQRACGAAAAGDPQPAAAEAAAQRPNQGGAGGAAGARPAADPQQQLLCGECCARACGTDCPRHGTMYIEWKCKYCCSLASWFCFGTTHMCEPCHSRVAHGRLPQVAANSGAQCADPKCGLKGTPHPPPGQEACLGCGMCRAGL